MPRTYGNPPPENYGCVCVGCRLRWKQRNDFIVKASAWLCEHRPDVEDVVSLAMKKACEIDPMPILFEDINMSDLLWLTDDQELRLYICEGVNRVQ